MQLDLSTARSRFQSVMEDAEAPAADRATAARDLSTIAWRFYKNDVEARSLLEEASDLGLEPQDYFFAAARLEFGAGNHAAARRSARRSREAASTASDDSRARIAFARSVVREAVALPVGATATEPLVSDLGEARDELGALIEEEPGLLEASRLLVQLALMTGDGATALAGWHSYYAILPGNEIPPLLQTSEAVLSRHLRRWDTARREPVGRTEAIQALAASGFHRIAGWLARESGPALEQSEDARAKLREISGYAEFLDRAKDVAEEYFRLSAIGGGSRSAFTSAFYAAGRQLWPELAWPGAVPGFTESRFREEISRRFGALVKFEKHDGVLCLHLGMRIVDKQYSVEQYGHRASLSFMVLDAMITNGYNSWFWDGTASAGGWVDEGGGIVQVRPAYAEGPVSAWRRVAHVSDREEWNKRMAEKSAGDDAIARENRYAYLPGLALRLMQRGHARVLEDLKNRGLDRQELRDAFTRELARRTHASSILAHEGRHAIDKRGSLSFLRRGAEKEYRAKLSEVALAPDPGLALTGAILSSNIGGNSSHGEANERIVKVLVDWMSANEDEIEGFDRTRPHLPQLDLLTDEQLRTAIQRVDPLAK